MQSSDPIPAVPKRFGNRAAVQYAIAMALLVAVVGGITWWKLNSRGGSTVKKTAGDKGKGKDVLLFPHTNIAVWYKNQDGDAEAKEKEPIQFKDFEPGTKGHYDFLFKNVFDGDVDIVSYASTCDCANVKACVLPADDWQRALKLQASDPGATLLYAREPGWHDLPIRKEKPDPDQASLPGVRVKAGEVGVIRVAWTANKAPGQELRIYPYIYVQPASDQSRLFFMPLNVGVKMRLPLQFYPPRAVTGAVTPGSIRTAKFIAWSATRDKLDFELLLVPPDPLFSIETKPSSAKAHAALKAELTKLGLGSHIAAAFEVTVTVRESLKGSRGLQQLEQGVFFRKFQVKFNGQFDESIPGPEVVGRVEGDIQIGGTDDKGKIRFKPFEAQAETRKTIHLAADAKFVLQHHSHKPDWIKVRLERETKKPADGQHLWLLEVTIPANTLDVRSFDERDAVVVRIAGTPERFVRIPLEGVVR